MPNAPTPRYQLAALMMLTSIGLAACTDIGPTETTTPGTVKPTLATVPCIVTVSTRSVDCSRSGAGVSAAIVGNQNVYLKIATTNVSYNPTTEIFGFDLTVQNLLNETMGTPGESRPDPNGIRVFFQGGPTVTGGTGMITVNNADGTAAFTGPNQPYFTYNEILDKDQVSSSKRWELSIPATVTTFSFLLLVDATIAPKLVINEVMANPSPDSDADAEWFELYNAGSLPVELENLVIADSAASGRRPYHRVSSSVVVQPGGYVVLAANTNTTTNLGVPADYAYGGSLSLANSLDAVKISMVFGTDTVTIDRTQYANAGVSAPSGISRELKNPALDNSNMDGSNWANASVTSVYGTGGRGTPKAQNSAYVP